MVLLESGQLGHNVFIDSYSTELKKLFDVKVIDKFIKLFHHVMDLSIEFCRVNCKSPCAGEPSFKVNQVIRLVDTHVDMYRPKFADQVDEIVIPGDIEDKLYNALLFSTIWGIGGTIDEDTRKRFDEFLLDLLKGEDVVEKHKLDMGKENKDKYPVTKWPSKVGEVESLFDHFYEQEENRWRHWEETVSKYTINKELTFLQLSIPTIDSIRMTNICNTLMR